jgi:pyruvate/2-oxoglutarate/acetoin dehydrogenase E1 component
VFQEVIIPYSPRDQQLLIHEASQDARFVVVVAHRRFGKTVAAINQGYTGGYRVPDR